MKNKFYKFAILIIVVCTVLLSSVYVLDQRQFALVLQFGEPVRQVLDPGLQFKIPIIQNVVFFDKRIQTLPFSPGDSSEVVALDQKTMTLDAFAKYKIVDPLKFYQSVQDEKKFKMRITSVLESSIREVVGSGLFIDVLSSKREAITEKVTAVVNREAERFGVEVLDVRIVRVNLPDKSRNAVYQRMRTDREKEAKEIRATGAEEAQIIRANADREKTVLLAEAQKQSSIVRGEGDAAAVTISSKSFSQDPDFFNFYRSMNAYKEVFSVENPSDSTIFISSDSEFLKYFDKK